MRAAATSLASDLAPAAVARSAAALGGPRSLAHSVALGFVWLTFATSGFVFTEPAPTDALAMMLCVILPTLGLTRITPLLVSYLALWLVCAAAGFLSATASHDLAKSTSHTVVSLYLYVASFMIAAFIAQKPKAHTELILGAAVFAALLAAFAGFAGYFSAFPGAFDLFTKYGRATGTFKDPNVFGPFLIPAFLYLLHVALNTKALRAALPLGSAGILALGVLLSFSRGAWFSLVVALGIYAVLAFVIAPNPAQRRRIVGFLALGVGLLAMIAASALQVEKVRDLLAERASLTQSYDVGPEGRFGGQRKAMALIAANPIGIGAGQFAAVYHHEEPHNVYLSMVLNAGWLGGGMFYLMTGLTIFLGAWRLTIPTRSRPLLAIAFAAFVGNALEGAIIDSDHWRHFYQIMTIVWGLACEPPLPAADRTSTSMA